MAVTGATEARSSGVGPNLEEAGQDGVHAGVVERLQDELPCVRLGEQPVDGSEADAGLERAGGEDEPDLLMLEPTDQEQEGGQGVRIGRIGVVDGHQDRGALTEGQDHPVEQGGDLVGLGRRSVGPGGALRSRVVAGQEQLERLGPLPRLHVAVGSGFGRLDQPAQHGERGLPLDHAPLGPKHHAAGPGGYIGGRVDEGGPSRAPGPLDGDAPAGHGQRTAEEGFELVEVHAALEQAGATMAPRTAVRRRRR